MNLHLKHSFKSINHLLTLSLILCFITLISCNKDSFSPKDNSQISNNGNVENTVDQFQLGNQLIADRSFEKKTYKEYPAPSKKRVSYIFEAREQSRRIYFHHNWINVDHNGKNEKYIVEFQTLTKEDKWSLLNPKGITGKVRIYNFNNEFIDYLSFEDGRLIYSFNNSQFIFDAQLSGSRDVPPCNPALGGGGVGVGNTITSYVWAWTTTEHYTDWWDFNPLTNEYTYSHEQYHGSTSQYEQIACVDLSGDASWNGEHYDIFEVIHTRKVIGIDDKDKTDGSGKTLPVVLIDPCNPQTPTMELAHDIVVAIAHKGDKGDSHSDDDLFLETLSGQEYHQLQLEINELANFNLVDPCNPQLGTNAILNEVIEGMADCTKSSFNASLANYDYITNLLGSCPKVDCMMDKLMGISNNPICDIMNQIDAATQYGITIEAGNVIHNTTGLPTSGQTSVSSNGNVVIQVDIGLSCNSTSPLEVATTVLHEMLHAEFYLEMQALGWDSQKNTEEQYWNLFIQNKMNETGKSHHAIITEYYIRPLAEALWNLNSNSGNIEDYYGYGLAGMYYELDSNGAQIANSFLKSSGITYLQAQQAYLTSKNVVPEVTSLTFNCP